MFIYVVEQRSQGSFINYVDKIMWVGGQKLTLVVHVQGTGTPPIKRFSYTAVFHLTRFFLSQKRIEKKKIFGKNFSTTFFSSNTYTV